MNKYIGILLLLLLLKYSTVKTSLMQGVPISQAPCGSRVTSWFMITLYHKHFDMECRVSNINTVLLENYSHLTKGVVKMCIAQTNNANRFSIFNINPERIIYLNFFNLFGGGRILKVGLPKCTAMFRMYIN